MIMSFALIKKISFNSAFDFMALRRLSLMFSGLLVLGSIAAFFTMGLNYGVDFRGGSLLEVRMKQAFQMDELRSELNSLDLGEIRLQEFGLPTDVLILVQYQVAETAEEEEKAQQAAIERIKAQLDDRVDQYRRTEVVGPTVSAELIEAGILATLIALGAIALYIAIRFEWRFALAALAALTHDVITTVGLFAILQLEFNLATVAAILTIAGYSINDTVVVFDRIRESLRKYKQKTVYELLNMALNATLTRTTMTSITTLLALLSLFIFGGPVIRDFSIALIWGVIIGTYSSLLLATPLVLILGLKATVFDKPEIDEEDGAAAYVKRMKSKRGDEDEEQG
jgi:preprotein translocase subunit SecF